MIHRTFLVFFLTLLPSLANAIPAAREADFVIKDFVFETGDKLDLRQHYRTLGYIKRDEDGKVTNAVLIMHGTTGSGAGFMRERFAGVLFEKGGLLDAEKYFIILPDAIGHGGSSKPSDGLAGAFPAYTYDDMVRAQHRLLNEHLGVNHLRLVTGTSMGGMFSWVWGYTYPNFMDAIMPLASLPVEIAGRNRMLRKMIIDAVKQDPAWNNGHYKNQPAGLKEAMYPLIMMVSSPLNYQQQAPTREESESMLSSMVERYASAMDANDLIWAFDASRFYNPQPHLDKIKAPLLAINSADDQVNPPELGILEKEIGRVEKGRAVTLPITTLTRGHGTHSLPSIWGPYLAKLLTQTQQQTITNKHRDGAILTSPDGPTWSGSVPSQYIARFVTTEGSFEIKVYRNWAPKGAERFYRLVKNGFYDGVAINRVVDGFIAQFGLSPSPQITAAWQNQAIGDDPVVNSNTQGKVAFAMTGPNTRNTQVYINLNDNSRLDKAGFAPFGEISSGMPVVERLYSLYGETAGGGMRGGKQGPIKELGRAYLEKHYPLLDVILHASILSE